ncbi:unnamed protein product, partial [Rotaria sp. Silwood1]
MMGYVVMTGIIGSFTLAGLILGLLALIFGLDKKVPTGTILLYSGSASKLIVSDDQWLFCNGSEVSRSTYRALFVVIGTTYGAGNGVDTFNLPDLRARFPFGSANLADNSFASGGAASHTLTVAELPAHTHDQGSLQTQNT